MLYHTKITLKTLILKFWIKRKILYIDRVAHYVNAETENGISIIARSEIITRRLVKPKCTYMRAVNASVFLLARNTYMFCPLFLFSYLDEDRSFLHLEFWIDPHLK